MVDVPKHHGISWFDLLQPTWIKRIRNQQLTNIKLGRFDAYSRVFAQGTSKLDYQALDLSVPLFYAKEAKVIDMRFKLCKKKMEIFEKLADPEPIQMASSLRRFPGLVFDNR